MKKRLFFLLISALVISLAAGCGSQPTTSEQEPGSEQQPVKDSLTVAYTDQVDSLDGYGSATLASERMCLLIDATLLRFDEDYNMVPYVAESWDVSEDGMVYTFHLRHDVYFSTGENVVAKDVVFSFNHGAASPFSSPWFIAFKEVRAIDDYTVEIELKYPYAPLLRTLCQPTNGIISQAAYEATGEDWYKNPISCGPYKVVDWSSTDKIVFERNEKFFEGVPPIKTINVVIIPDPSTKVIALQNGEIDAAVDVDSYQRQNVLNDKNLVLAEVPSSRYCYLGFNMSEEPFKSNLKLRQAINYAIDVEAVIASAMDGIAVPATCTMASNAECFPKDLKPYPYDLEKAKQLMAESGVKDLDINLVCRSAGEQKVGQVIQSCLAEIDIKVTVLQLETGGYYDAADKSTFDTIIGTWGDSLLDPDGVIGYRYNSKLLGSAGNVLRVSDPKLDQYIKDGYSAIDPKKREQIYAECFQYVKDQAYEVPLFYFIYNVAYHKDLKNAGPNTTNMIFYHTWSW